MTPNRRTLGELVAWVRTEKCNQSQERFGKQLGFLLEDKPISRRTIIRWETGQRDVPDTMRFWYALAFMANIPIDELQAMCRPKTQSTLWKAPYPLKLVSPNLLDNKSIMDAINIARHGRFLKTSGESFTGARNRYDEAQSLVKKVGAEHFAIYLAIQEGGLSGVLGNLEKRTSTLQYVYSQVLYDDERVRQQLPHILRTLVARAEQSALYSDLERGYSHRVISVGLVLIEKFSLQGDFISLSRNYNLLSHASRDLGDFDSQMNYAIRSEELAKFLANVPSHMYDMFIDNSPTQGNLYTLDHARYALLDAYINAGDFERALELGILLDVAPDSTRAIQSHVWLAFLFMKHVHLMGEPHATEPTFITSIDASYNKCIAQLTEAPYNRILLLHRYGRILRWSNRDKEAESILMQGSQLATTQANLLYFAFLQVELSLLHSKQRRFDVAVADLNVIKGIVAELNNPLLTNEYKEALEAAVDNSGK